MNMELKDMTLDEVVGQLERLRSTDPATKDWKIRIAWSTGRRSCVGKIIGIADGNGSGTAYMFPVPEDIGAINSLTRLTVRLSCDKAAEDGRGCGTCPDAGDCEILKRIEGSYKALFEGGKEDDGGK